MIEEVLLGKGTTLVRRLRLEPGECMHWHRDPFKRITIVMAGEKISVEFREGGRIEEYDVKPGQVDWEEPTPGVHRGVNNGSVPYEDITIFFLNQPGDDHQPRAK